MNLFCVQVAVRIMLDLNELEELRLNIYENAQIYKKKTMKRHDRKIIPKQFVEGQKVLLFNSKLKLFAEKLKSKWSGPFLVLKVFPYGVLKLKNERTDQVFRVNGHRAKPFLENTHAVSFKQVECLFLQ